MSQRIRRPGLRRPRLRRNAAGQGLVEFSLVLIPFLFLLMGIVDLGRGIYINNAVAEAAREIARVTSVHPCTGSPCTAYSAETLAAISTQKGMVPGMTDSSVVIDCTDIADNQIVVASGSYCPAMSDDQPTFVRVKISVPFSVLTPLIPVPKDFTLGSISHIQIP
jgi:Flp pilus assembly protein TadG